MYTLVFGILPQVRSHEFAVTGFIRLSAGLTLILLFSSFALMWLELSQIPHAHLISLLLGSAFFLVFLAQRFDQDLFVPMSKEIVILAGETPKLYLGVYSLVFFILLRTISPDFMGDTINYHMYMASLFARDKMFLPELPFWYIYTFLQMPNEVVYSYFLKVSDSGFVLGRLWSTSVVFFIFFLIPAMSLKLHWNRTMAWLLCCGLLAGTMMLSLIANMSADAMIAGIVGMSLVWSLHFFLSADDSGTFSFLMAFIFFCIALGSRVNSAFFVPPAILVLIWVFLVRKDVGAGIRVKTMLFLPVLALFFGGFWFLRAYICVGNPVFPFYNKLFQSDFFPIANLMSWSNINLGRENFWKLPYHVLYHPFLHAFSSMSHTPRKIILLLEPTLFCCLAGFGILIGKKYPSDLKRLTCMALISYCAWVLFIDFGRYVVPFLPVCLLFVGAYLQKRIPFLNRRLLVAGGIVYILASYVCAQDWGGYRSSTCIPALARQPDIGKQEDMRFKPQFWESVNSKIDKASYILCELERGEYYFGMYLDPVVIDLSGFLLNEYARINGRQVVEVDVKHIITTQVVFDDYLRGTITEKYKWKIKDVRSLGREFDKDFLLVQIEINPDSHGAYDKIDLWKPYYLYDHLRLVPKPPEMNGIIFPPLGRGKYRYISGQDGKDRFIIGTKILE
jgi:hypothetical protein